MNSGRKTVPHSAEKCSRDHLNLPSSCMVHTFPPLKRCVCKCLKVLEDGKKIFQAVPLHLEKPRLAPGQVDESAEHAHADGDLPKGGSGEEARGKEQSRERHMPYLFLS